MINTKSANYNITIKIITRSKMYSNLNWDYNLLRKLSRGCSLLLVPTATSPSFILTEKWERDTVRGCQTTVLLDEGSKDKLRETLL